MADPRKTTAFDGIGFRAETFSADNSTIVWSNVVGGAAATMLNKAVTLSSARTVALCADGDAITGKLILVEPDGKCVVQTEGYCDLPGGSAASLTLDKHFVGALGAASAKGYIREVATGTAAELGKQRGQIIDAADTTAVIVKL
jgi:hypothetical protein